MPHVLGGLLALGALTAAAATAGGASAEPVAKRGNTVTINIALDGDRFKFDGPATVQTGGILEVNNQTDPSEVGPHTFSLVKKESLLPKGEGERGKCGRLKLPVCKRIGDEHGFTDPRPPTYTTKTVENGDPGWDKAFTGRKDGDSYLLDVENETYWGPVSFQPGTKFYLLCLIYPRMQKQIEVEAG